MVKKKGDLYIKIWKMECNKVFDVSTGKETISFFFKFIFNEKNSQLLQILKCKASLKPQNT